MDAHRVGRHAVHEVTVVRNQNELPLPPLQKLSKPPDREDVEVVGRLIEEKTIGLGDQNLSQMESQMETSRELVGGGLHVLFCKSETKEDRLSLVEMILLPRREGQSRLFEDGWLGKADVLLQVADAVVFGDADVSPIGLNLPIDQAEKGRLTRTVAPDKTTPLSPSENKGGLLEETMPTKCQADPIELNHKNPLSLLYFSPMLLFSSESLSKAFGTRELFSELTISIFEGDHIGLIGQNGSGKSTLLKIIAGLENADKGTLSSRRGLKIGYLPQSCDFPDQKPFELLLEAAPHQLPDYERELLVKTWMSKLGFTGDEPNAAYLSGGWKKRLRLAQEMLNSPDLLMLDEPTNHLDLEVACSIFEEVARGVHSDFARP